MRLVSGVNLVTFTNTVFSKHFNKKLWQNSISKLLLILSGQPFWIQGPCVRVYQPTEGCTRRKNCKRVWLSWSSSTLDSDEEFATDGIAWSRWSKVGLYALTVCCECHTESKIKNKGVDICGSYYYRLKNLW